MHEDDDPLCTSFSFFVVTPAVLPPRTLGAYSATRFFLFSDERLGKLFKAVPPNEDVYVYQNNGPTFAENA